MKFSSLLASALIVSLLFGCSSRQNYYAMGGSRADGTVDLAYDTKMFVTPIVNDQQAQEIATQKCKVWGYQDAESFGGMTENCFARNSYGDCLRGQVIVKYQCLGDGAVDSPALSKGAAVTKESYKQEQLDRLLEQNLPYDQYMAKRRIIEAQ